MGPVKRAAAVRRQSPEHHPKVAFPCGCHPGYHSARNACELAIFLMDDCRQELAQQLAAVRYRSPHTSGELCLISLAPSRARVTQEKKMEYTQQNDQVSIYQSNFRAEDGATAGPSNALYEGVVVPLASLFAVVLFVVGAMLLKHYPATTISEKSAIPEKSPSTLSSSASRFARTSASGAITITASKNASTCGRSVAIAPAPPCNSSPRADPSPRAASSADRSASAFSVGSVNSTAFTLDPAANPLLRRLRQNILHPLERR